MSTEFLRAFATNFEVEEIGSTGVAPMQFVASDVSLSAPAVTLEVRPLSGSLWQGEFFGGRDPFSAVASTPNPEVLLVVAGGQGYLAPVRLPERYETVRLRPIRMILGERDGRVLILVGWTEIAAIGDTGKVAWRSQRLVADGFEEVRLASGVVVVRGHDTMSSATVETTVDLVSGSVISRSA